MARRGIDTLVFNGANVAENIGISANGTHVQFTRDVANISMDRERDRERSRSTRSAAPIRSRSTTSAGTDVNQVGIDLAATPGGNVGDGAADTVIVNGSGNADHVTVGLSG